jgi:hypothetical protein
MKLGITTENIDKYIASRVFIEDSTWQIINKIFADALDQMEIQTDEAGGQNDDNDSETTAETILDDQPAQQRSASLSITSNEESEKNHKVAAISTADSSEANPLPDNLLWVNELPNWLQEQTLNSTPIKSLIKSARQMAAGFELKSAQDLFTSMLSIQPSGYSGDEVASSIDEKVTRHDNPSEGLIDESLIVNDPAVSDWILLLLIGSSNKFFAESVFNGLQPNLNGIELY